ncbi:MAG: DUF4392 domain-containing protein, partial [Gemmatales bacterium]|nr:DUF4392 domain-containing protein [Gemmatales bacterium]MDW7996043.1 DUF4392 domain-containing protein [Gemmatales bacterium]
PADWLILATVSNWGAYALAAALCLLHRDWVLFSRLAHAERDLWLEVCRAHLLCDGVTGQLANHDDDFWVDGFPWRVHAAILDEITGILRTSLP